MIWIWIAILAANLVLQVMQYFRLRAWRKQLERDL